MDRFKPKNIHRADQASAAIEAYRVAHPDQAEISDIELVTDLVTDALHWLRREGFDPSGVPGMALIHYTEEA